MLALVTLDGKVYFHNMDVVYTKEAETADLYIEKAAHELTRQYKVTVATSDAVEQVIIFGTGAFRMSAQMLLEGSVRAGDTLEAVCSGEGITLLRV